MPDVRVFSDPWGHHVSHLRGRLDEGLHGCIDVRPPAEPQVEAEQHQRGQGAVPRHGSDRRCHGDRRPRLCPCGQRTRPAAGVVINVGGGRCGKSGAVEPRNHGPTFCSAEEASNRHPARAETAGAGTDAAGRCTETGARATQARYAASGKTREGESHGSQEAGATRSRTTSASIGSTAARNRSARAAIRCEGFERCDLPAIRL